MRRIATVLCLLLTLAASAPARAQWLPDGLPVCTAPGDQLALAGTPFPFPGPAWIRFGLLTVWEDHRAAGTSGIDLFAASVDESGPQPEFALCTAPGDQTAATTARVDVACGYQGGCVDAIVAWQDARSGGDSDIFANRLHQPWAADGVPVCRMPMAQQTPAIVAVDDGSSLPRETLVVWRDERDGVGNLYAQRLDADGQRMWDTTGVVVCDAPYDQWEPRATTGFEPGGVLVAWMDQRAFPAPATLYVQSLDAAGAPAPGWPANGLALATDHATGEFRVLAGGFVVWTEGLGAARRLRVTRVAAAGGFAPGWSDSGLAVTPVVREQSLADAALDGAGGVLVSWLDVVERSVTYTPSIALRVQRLDGTGAPVAGWGAGGALVTGFPSALGGGALAPQTDGGAIVVWSGPDGHDGGILAQRLAPDGAVARFWPAAGVVMCPASGAQSAPVAASTYGGAIAAWVDGRNGPSSDLFAQFVTESGLPGPGAVDGMPVGGLRLGAPMPDPTHGAVRFALELPVGGTVVADVHDLAGRRVRALGSGPRAAGRQTLVWDGQDEAGRPVPPGLYLVRVITPSGEAHARVVRLR